MDRLKPVDRNMPHPPDAPRGTHTDSSIWWGGAWEPELNRRADGIQKNPLSASKRVKTRRIASSSSISGLEHIFGWPRGDFLRKLDR
jgi:hypothetical protein